MGAVVVMIVVMLLAVFIAACVEGWAMEGRWRRVIQPHEVTTWGYCPVCAIKFNRCPCPGPDDPAMEYRFNDNGVLQGRERR